MRLYLNRHLRQYVQSGSCWLVLALCFTNQALAATLECETAYDELNQHLREVNPLRSQVSVSLRGNQGSPPTPEQTSTGITSILKVIPTALRDLLFSKGFVQDGVYAHIAKGENFGLTLDENIIAQSYHHMETVWPRWTRFGSDLMMVRGDVFLEGYFREHRYQTGRTDPNRPSFAVYSQRQPWLQWIPGKGEYVLRQDGAQEQILNHVRQWMGENVTLYRGLSTQQANLIRLVKQLRKKLFSSEAKQTAAEQINRMADEFPSLNASRDKFEAAAKDLLNSASIQEQAQIARRLLEFRFSPENGDEAFFTTPTYEIAAQYGNGGKEVLKSTLPINLLLRLSRSSNLYAGIEYKYFEFMFYGPGAIEAFADHMK